MTININKYISATKMENKKISMSSTSYRYHAMSTVNTWMKELISY